MKKLEGKFEWAMDFLEKKIPSAQSLKIKIPFQKRNNLFQFQRSKLKFVQKTRQITRRQYCSIFGDFSGGFKCVLVQLLLIKTLFSVEFYVTRKAILSSIW